MDAKTGDMGCPVDRPTTVRSLLGRTNRDWWPNRSPSKSSTRAELRPTRWATDFDYAEAFKSLDYQALKRDLTALMTDSQPWWPADYGHYGPFFIRMAWHAAGTYRTGDGRGGATSGQQRFAPLNSWPDNANLDKARRLLWPIKQKYGRRPQLGRPVDPGRQRRDRIDGRADLRFRRRPRGRLRARERHLLGHRGAVGRRLQRRASSRSARWMLEYPLAAIQMGLIYVNPEGPGGNPDPLQSARDIRETFARMAMNDEETVALTAGGHTFGKAHGAGDASHGRRRAGGRGHRAAGARLAERPSRAAWATTPSPAASRARGRRRRRNGDMNYFHMLLDYEYELVRQPGGREAMAAGQPEARGPGARRAQPRPRVPTMMTTADMAFEMDPEYRKISERFRNDPDGVRRRLRTGVVQAHPSRHGAEGPLSRPRGAGRGPDLAGSGSGRDQPSTTATLPSFKDEDPRVRAQRRRAGQDGLGFGLDLRNRTIAAAPMARASALRRRRTGTSTSRRSWRRCSARGIDESARAASSHRRPDRARRQRLRSRRRRRMPATTSTCRSAGGRGDATEEQTDAESFEVLEPTGRRVPQLSPGPLQRADRGVAARPRAAARPHARRR